MAATDQLQYESAVRERYGAIAFVAGLTLVASQLLGLTGSHAKVNELTVDLIAANQRVGLDIVGSVLDLIGLIALGITMTWLHGVTRFRRPELKQIIRWIVLIGALVTGVMALAYTVIIAIKANQFVSGGDQSFLEANRLTRSGLVVAVPLVLELGTLLLAMGCVWVSLNAMRAGLVTRFVGYSGVAAGALFVFPIGALVPLVQGYWLGGLALILAARWPSGDPPAWKAGEAIPWTPLNPPGSDRQQQRQQSRQRGKRGKQAPARPSLMSMLTRGASTPPPPPTKQSGSKPTPAPRAGTPKRKRKRRS